MPNDLGLFDMQGNVFEWCLDRGIYYPTGKSGARIDNVTSGIIRITNSRVMRGSSLGGQAADVRSAYRGNGVPAIQFFLVGFRPARTFTP